MAAPLASVVVPTYNAPGLLLETLATALAQTCGDFEVVVINDGSSDDTLERLAPLQREHGGRLRIVTQPNAGIGAARNRGLDEARGRYVALLDHDDLWEPAKLATQLDYMRAHPQCAACGTVFALSTAPGRPHFTRSQVAGVDGIVRRPMWETIHGRDVFQTSTLMIDAERTRGLRYGLARGAIEDVQFHIGLMGRGAYGIAGDTVLATYRVFEGNASKNPDFYYRGIAHLRGLQRAGAFDDLPEPQRTDADLWLGHIARFTCVGELSAGRRRRAASLYGREWTLQFRRGRARFLAGFPLMWLSRGLLGRRSAGLQQQQA